MRKGHLNPSPLKPSNPLNSFLCSRPIRMDTTYSAMLIRSLANISLLANDASAMARFAGEIYGFIAASANEQVDVACRYHPAPSPRLPDSSQHPDQSSAVSVSLYASGLAGDLSSKAKIKIYPRHLPRRAIPVLD
ncbi:hypothetical protein AJ80_03067 [Polytolypa hystricis UAMH7299]|uniref:Uncharacterized protein n=1 Tax=Polytolypa hystricis (strain UAMH7299) TaxID=1447883 RepID=A0A2B7YC31_POLH7|nr:hypothetical protein AJ80_03067 [Polytolypa hystricis UAMH7299]